MNEQEINEWKATRKRLIMHDTLYVLRRLCDHYNGLELPSDPESDFDDVLVVINLAIAKLDAIDAHPSGQPDLTAIRRAHLKAVQEWT